MPFGESVKSASLTTGKKRPVVTAWIKRATTISGNEVAKKPSNDPASANRHPVNMILRMPKRRRSEAAVVMAVAFTMAKPSTTQFASERRMSYCVAI